MANYGINIGPYQWKGLADGWGVNIGLYQGNAAPEITGQSPDQSGCIGDVVILWITATGSPIPSYQWYKNGHLIPGAIMSTYEFFATYQDAGTYTCVASNLVGNTPSGPIVVTVVRNSYHYSAFNRQIDQDRS